MNLASGASESAWWLSRDIDAIRFGSPKAGSHVVTALEAGTSYLKRRWLIWKLYRPNQAPVRLRGMSHLVAIQVQAALGRVMLEADLRSMVDVHSCLLSSCAAGRAGQRWVPWDVRDTFLAGWDETLVERVQRSSAASTLTVEERQALRFGLEEMHALVDQTNEAILDAELLSEQHLFDTIESQPLTPEQAQAVVTFDNRVQVLAAAGSGKTSVMVARAAYAVSRGFVAPERILLLAFNRKAAEELKERVTERFAAAGLDSAGVQASTFHKFGLSVIGHATGKKPSVAPWVAHEQSRQEKISEIVDVLRDSNTEFRYRWDLFRLVFAQVSMDPNGGRPDTYDSDKKSSTYATLNGETVRSEGERMIADWLFLNGVEYKYEEKYVIDVADAEHSQYRPDFYYPDIDAWHEHWGLGRDGKPPAEFHGYEESMQWKRALHAEHSTDLIETTFAEIVLGDGGFTGLEQALTSRGVSLDWNPEQPTVNKPVSNEQMVELVGTFLSHVKSSAASPDTIQAALDHDRRDLAGTRTRTFLGIFWPIHKEWERQLRFGAFVDFDDMLTNAADLVANGHDPGYDLVLVDEFQDSSRVRARLVREMLGTGSRFLLTVGDDWQAINRFAGADLSVMTNFHNYFGPGQQLALTTTFRCSQEICEVASTFVKKNPQQLDKVMRSINPDAIGAPVTIVFANNRALAVTAHLNRLSRQVGTGRASVFVLGRYNFERSDTMPEKTPENLDVSFATVHSSKGREADHVIVPGMNSGVYGFPSTITDDPVLDLVMGERDTLEHAEERRIFYVAMTRARKSVLLIASQNQPSPFITELLENARPGRVVQVGLNGEPVEIAAQVKPCPLCKTGTLVLRTSKFGRFTGCSNFPRCTHKSSDLTQAARHAAASDKPAPRSSAAERSATPDEPREVTPTSHPTEFTIEEAAKAWDAPADTIRKLLNRNVFPNAHKTGGETWLIPGGDLLAARLEPGKPSPPDETHGVAATAQPTKLTPNAAQRVEPTGTTPLKARPAASLSTENVNTLPDAVADQFGVEAEGGPKRFSSPGWFYTGQTTAKCPRCSGVLEGFRAPYTNSAGVGYHYWGLACLKCRTLWPAQEIDAADRKRLYNQSKHRPTKPQ